MSSCRSLATYTLPFATTGTRFAFEFDSPQLPATAWKSVSSSEPLLGGSEVNAKSVMSPCIFSGRASAQMIAPEFAPSDETLVKKP